MQVGAFQSQGARKYQEDNLGVLKVDNNHKGPTGYLVIVADGMGGHVHGATASQIAVDEFIKAFKASQGPIRARLKEALDHCNNEIVSAALKDPELKGMGCTFLGAFITPDECLWVSVGDSILWVLQNGTLRRLNDDHSMKPVLNEWISSGEITSEEAADHPHRNSLRSALGEGLVDLIDLPKAPYAFNASERLIFASDGILTLNEEEIIAALDPDSSQSTEEAAHQLVANVDAKNRPKQDNTTVIVVDPGKHEHSNAFNKDSQKPQRKRSLFARDRRNLLVALAGFFFVAILGILFILRTLFNIEM